jgi:glycosyltransferase involved in cell wall biosynthesis
VTFYSTDIAVIIPCYNDGQFLLKALDSLYAQTFQNWEAVVVDDGSTDPSTIENVEKIDHAQIKVIHHKENFGLAAARNTGIKLTKAPVIFPLDADDVLTLDALEVVVKAFDAAPEVSLFYPDFERFGQERGLFQPPDMEFALMVKKHFAHAASPFRRAAWEAAGGYCEDETLRLGMEDVDFHYALLERGFVFRPLRKTVYKYRTRQESLSDRMQRHNYEIRRFIASRHKGLLRGRLRRDCLQAGAIRSYRATIASGADWKTVLLNAVRIQRHCMWPPRLWWRAMWNIFQPLFFSS